jgi:hypothetical protein
MAETTSLHLRLPKALYKKLRRQARANNASLNTEIVNLLTHTIPIPDEKYRELMEIIIKLARDDLEARRKLRERGIKAPEGLVLGPDDKDLLDEKK